MKLLYKTNRAYLILVSLLFPLMILADYYLIVYLVNREVNELLRHEGQRIKYNWGTVPPFQSSDYVLGTYPQYEVQLTRTNHYRDTLIYDNMKDDMVPYRLYEFTVPDAKGNTRVVLKHILLEPQALIVWLFGYTALIMFLLAVGIFLINQRIYRWAFRPFFTNLAQIRNYDLRERKKVDWETTDIGEFTELNQVISLLMDRVEKDYENLKELNENIAHEIQTPLAVVRNKAVNLLDSSSLNEDQLKQVKTIYNEANRLSRIGKSLTLISRINNQEFRCSDSIDVRGMTLEILGDLEEMIAYRKLRVNQELEEVRIKGDAELSRILLVNLIKNAIQHNEDGGEIRISLTAEAMRITNTGPTSQIPPEKVFTRFSRSLSHTSGLGLGLAICKKISSLCFMDLSYRTTDNLHHFELCFNTVQSPTEENYTIKTASRSPD